MTRNQDHDDDDASSSSSSSSSRKRINTFDKEGVEPWSDLSHDVLFLVMMQLGVVDFLALSGVCKSWRSFAFLNKNTFMASQPPMSIEIDHPADNQDSYCYLDDDFKGRSFSSNLPHSGGRICTGITCGYLILFGRETCDFWLVNPITRHELHFPDFPYFVGAGEVDIRAILVFSASLYGWVFVTLYRNSCRKNMTKPKLSFYIEGKRGWNHVSFTRNILDLYVFKGKIYTLRIDYSLCELRLDLRRKRKWTLHDYKSLSECPPHPCLHRPELVSSGENLYMICRVSNRIMELDLGEMKWVLPKKTIDFYVGVFKSSAAVKRESWGDPQTQCERYDYDLDTYHKGRIHIFYNRNMWYFPHDCLNVNLLHE